MAIYIENDSGIKFDFHYRKTLENAVTTVMSELSVPDGLDVNVMIVTPDEMKSINNDTRGIDKVTDVLSFPYFQLDPDEGYSFDDISWNEGDIFGDIVLCGEKIISQAEEYGHSQKREMVFLTVHSLLHLSGYDHMEPEDAAKMEEKQEILMNKLGILR